MADAHLPEDEALLYVLGELTPAERSKFEARLTQSAELRATVRDLEEGALALSLASPRRRPPQQVWRQIQKRVATQSGFKAHLAAFWNHCSRHGWAAATACLAGWLLYALWVNRANSPGSLASESAPQRPPTWTHNQGELTAPAPTPKAATYDYAQLLQISTQEIGVLRWQLAELTNRLSQLSQAVAKKEALLAEPGRFKFFQLVPSAGGRASATSMPVSPGLQQALVVAMARELGWQTSGPPVEMTGAEDSRGHISSSYRTNYAGVDLVDLRAATNNQVAAASTQPQVELTPAETATTPTQPESVPQPATTEISSAASTSTSAVPGFIPGTGSNAVLAFDSSVVPSGSLLTFWSTSANGGYQSLGGAILGNNPMAVLVPLNYAGNSSASFTVTAGMPNGPSNVLGHFWTQGSSSP